jgi:ABC-type branched-subunit amino acid transport system substrate-binding protein
MTTSGRIALRLHAGTPRCAQTTYRRVAAALACALLATGCERVIGLEKFRVTSEAAQTAELECKQHADCRDAAAPFCVRASGRCAALESTDCVDISGPTDADNALVLGALLAFDDSQGGLNRARLRSMQMAVEELNALGGVPLQPGAEPSRPLLLVACDESKNGERAAQHLTDDLRVAAILGPTGSQVSLDVTTRVTIPKNTLTLSPTALAESLAELSDNDMSWLMVPSDAQRGPLLRHQIATLERALRKERGRDLKLGMVFQDDALGAGTRAALVELTWNDEALSLASNLGTHVHLASYDPTRDTHPDLIADYSDFAPDLVVLVGGSSLVDDVLAKLEAAWTADERPEYLLIDAAKGPSLLQLVAETPELAARVRGTGVSPSSESQPVYRSFLLDYESHYPGDVLASGAGVGPSYDAVYALAYALVAANGETSADIARGLRGLHAPAASELTAVGPTTTLAAFRALKAEQPVALQGTFSALRWDERGAIASGTLEVWCVEVAGDVATYKSSGLTATLPFADVQGENRVCPARSEAPQPTAADAGMPPAQEPVRGDAGMPDAAVPQDAGTPPPTPDAEEPRGPGMPRPPGMRAIPCGTTSCDRTQREYCCIETILGEAGATQSKFKCETGPAMCAAVLSCSSDLQCEPGQVCCLSGERRSTCRAAGGCGGDLNLACDTPEDCPSGEVCCAVGADADAVRATRCAKDCSSSAYPGLVCQKDQHCPAPSVCRQSWDLPSVGLCY